MATAKPTNSAASIAVGLIDTGLDTGSAARFASYQLRCFGRASEASTSHGSAVTASWAATAGQLQLFNAAIFDDSLRTSQGDLIAALQWLADCDVQLIHMSLGLRQPSEPLAALCAQLSAAGVLLVASAPAQGEPVYPANFSGVISASGDARCQPGEISQLSQQASDGGPQWGGCVFSTAHPLRGASIGAGAVSAALLAELASGGRADHCLAALAARAAYRGREYRQPTAEQLP